MEKRLFIISNRLPVTVEKSGDGVHAKKSSGGLVSAIESFLLCGAETSFTRISWVGTPCCETSEWENVLSQVETNTHNYIPVYLNKNIYEKYYNGFANSTIWPLFHYFPSYTEYSRDNYASYESVNESFAQVLQKHLRPTDVVWIHDYHLMPLASLVRKFMPEVTIGFFLHIPFPCYEVFRLLPKQWQREIITGLLGADLIGFHTIDYATHFVKTVQMVLGYEADLNVITHENRLIKVDVFPISIDFQKFNEAYDEKNVVHHRAELLNNFTGKRIIFSVDRLDYTKGVGHRLEGYKLFLENNPQYREKVVFVIVIVPSREYIPRYAERKKMIDEMIGNINSKLGSIHWQPVIYQYSSLNFDRMVALYTACDVALITPLRDGMNLVAKEFVASRKDRKGVLLLSEMAGAARELTTALHINPNDVEEIAAAIKKAFEMDITDQQQRMQAMQNRIAAYNVNTWASDFLSQLYLIKIKQQEFQVKFIDTGDRTAILQDYMAATRRIILLDYDGTLVPYSLCPEKAKPDLRLSELLMRLGSRGNELYVISGRSSKMLDTWFSALPVNLISEHGSKIRKAGCDWKTLVRVSESWKPEIEKIMQQYVKRCANTFIEEKEFGMVWHYRNAQPEQARLRSIEMQAELTEVTRQLGMQVMTGNKTIEVKAAGADKGSAIGNHIMPMPSDFILAIGDDKTDEDMFRMLVKYKHAYTVKVGSEASFAKYNLHTPHMVLSLLNAIASCPIASLNVLPTLTIK